MGRALSLFSEDLKQRLGVLLGAPHVRWSLIQLSRFGFRPKHVMDVGAFVGGWTRVCLEIFPGTHITCIEPQSSVQNTLQKLMANHPNVKVIQTLLGREEKEGISFEERETGGSSVVQKSTTGTKLPMTTIDRLVQKGLCEPPEFLKLDVQGYEMEVLEGYRQCFDVCQVIQCEISLLPIVEGAPLLHEVAAYLHGRGFIMFDVDELIRSPSDGAVWQVDALFCREESHLRTKRTWRKMA